jgi:hypothetical protein
LTPDDVLDIIADSGLGWDESTQTGSVFHMVNARWSWRPPCGHLHRQRRRRRRCPLRQDRGGTCRSSPGLEPAVGSIAALTAIVVSLELCRRAPLAEQRRVTRRREPAASAQRGYGSDRTNAAARSVSAAPANITTCPASPDDRFSDETRNPPHRPCATCKPSDRRCAPKTKDEPQLSAIHRGMQRGA